MVIVTSSWLVVTTLNKKLSPNKNIVFSKINVYRKTRLTKGFLIDKLFDVLLIMNSLKCQKIV